MLDAIPDLTREFDPAEVAALRREGVAEPAPAETRRPGRRRGRGATINPASRFDAQVVAPFDDGWSTLADGLEGLEEPPAVATTLTRDSSRSVISWNDSPDIGFDRAVNPYRGCEHGCVYCYARPSHAYLGWSPGLDFETKLLYKPDVAQVLERELRKPGYVARPMALGSNTDPYQPVERTLQLTRAVLTVLDRCDHPCSIVTKSAGVLRDVDILERMARRNLVRVWISVTTLDGRLARVMEPRAAAPARRLQAIRGLAEAGVPVGVLAAPMIPGLNDSELERIVAAVKEAGAQCAGYVLLRLPHELRQIFQDWLEQHMPDRAAKVLELIRQTRAGKLNDARFGHRFSGSGPYADMLAQRFSRAVRQYGLEFRPELDCSRFRPPAEGRGAEAGAQLRLF